MKINVTSEVGELEGVILHTPGPEVENMTPKNAERALYSDILNLSVVNKEYFQFKSILEKVTTTFQVEKLLKDILSKKDVKTSLIKRICENENTPEIVEFLNEQPEKELAKLLIQGVPLVRDNLTSFLSKERYTLRPLHNFFFTRDSAIAIRDKVLIGRMANRVREREAIIMDAIFCNHDQFEADLVVNPIDVTEDLRVTIEGGDILIAREDIILIGFSARTTTQGIDFIIEQLKRTGENRHIIVQELPPSPESFIHLDMVFTFVDLDKCMIYEPVIMNPNRYKTVHIEINGGKVVKIVEEKNIIEALAKLKMEITPIYCGGRTDPWIQEREQWHSGANFFALGPGKVISYDRNNYTLDELNKVGFEILKSNDILAKKIDLKDYKKYVITIRGSELSRGGGGCRCMTMPVSRKSINF